VGRGVVVGGVGLGMSMDISEAKHIEKHGATYCHPILFNFQ